VAKALGLDARIGPKFLHPGPGFGGSCFPKDTRALVEIAREHGCRMQLVETAIEVNDRQRVRMVDKVVRALGVDAASRPPGPGPGSLAGRTIGVLGLAFKPNTDDIRESPALAVIGELLALGARVRAYDPAAVEAARDVLPGVDYQSDAYAVAEGADALVLLTEWNQFRNLDLERMKTTMRHPILLDLRNVYEPEKVKSLGFQYEAVGRR
jgi:UDPglucose 6-dehydrogenase